MTLLQQKSTQASTYPSASSGDEIVLGCHCGIVGELCSDGVLVPDRIYAKALEATSLSSRQCISVNQCCSALNHIRSATFDFTWRTPSTFITICYKLIDLERTERM